MREEWTEDFGRRAQEHWTDAEVDRLGKGKSLLLDPRKAPMLLRAIGLLHRDASMPPPQVRKFLQLNHMLRLLGPPLRELMERFDRLTLVDAGCGLSYLTISLAWCFEHVFEHPATIIGIDRDEKLIARCREKCRAAGVEHRLRFEARPIQDFSSDTRIHGLISLHACDTATDDAILLGLAHEAELIAVAPCCQAELARALSECPRPMGPLTPLWDTPHLRREAGATMTDAIRMLFLRAAGYETRVVEFVPSEHSTKNTLIRAMKRGAIDETAVTELRALLDSLGRPSLRLQDGLPSDLAASLWGSS